MENFKKHIVIIERNNIIHWIDCDDDGLEFKQLNDSAGFLRSRTLFFLLMISVPKDDEEFHKLFIEQLPCSVIQWNDHFNIDIWKKYITSCNGDIDTMMENCFPESDEADLENNLFHKTFKKNNIQPNNIETISNEMATLSLNSEEENNQLPLPPPPPILPPISTDTTTTTTGTGIGTDFVTVINNNNTHN